MKKQDRGPAALPVVGVLMAARARIAKDWTTGWYAKNTAGREVDWDDPAASCWCAAGAVYAAIGINYSRLGEITQQQRDMMDRCADLVAGGYLPEWNDSRRRTQRSVVAAFDRAIVKATAGGASASENVPTAAAPAASEKEGTP